MVTKGGLGAETLTGTSGDDVIDGGGGADTMIGLTGNDRYYVDNAGDQITEAIGQGADHVYSTVDYTLAAGQEIESLRAYGIATGLVLTANEFGNYLVGDAGSDTLNGEGGDDGLKGGAGADFMAGGTGNDRYYVDNAGDQITEAIGQGTDHVYSTVDYTLAAGQEIESLRAYGIATGLVLTGNEFGNYLVGDAGSDTLNGEGGDDGLNGGAGADFMAGGTGNDRYYVDNAGDQITEAIGQGTDHVYSTVDYTLAAGQEIESLRAYGIATGLVLTGNEFGNYLVGDAGSDTLNGGVGADTMAGRGGDDTYYADAAGDQVIEATGGGSDTIYASVDYTLATGQEIESLRVDGENGLHLTANDFGMELVGSEGADTLTGGAGSDVIAGGAGADIIDGGAGADVMDGGDFSVGDTFHVDNVGDQVVGHVFSSTIYTSVDFTVSGGVDSATVYAVGPTGLHLTGGSGINTLVGADGDDTLTGGAFVNSLDGGAGADIMIGGADADYYYVDNAGDQVIEAESDNIIGKFDTIYASVDYTLAAGQEVEYLRVAGVNGLRLTGNDFGMELVGAEGSDTLTGGAGNDTIEGGAQLSGPFDPPPGDTLRGGAGDDHIFGGAGSDVIDGGAGADVMDTGSEYFGSLIDGTIMGIPSSDTIYVDNAGDQVFGSTWTSTIYVSTDWTATGNVSGATMRVVGSAGLHLTASGIKYALIGGAGDDTLTAGGFTIVLDGGAGADIMKGGTGRNTYYVDNIGDQVIDAPQNDGTGFSGDPPRSDIIYTSVDYTVAAGQEIEHMYATGVNGLRLTGNEFAMNLYGNVGDDTLNGDGGADTLNGGAGNDLLVGGTGNDILVFGLASGHDKVGDFTPGTDKIDLTAYDFASFAEVMTLASDVGANTVITLDAFDTVTLSGVHTSQLNSGDFLL